MAVRFSCAIHRSAPLGLLLGIAAACGEDGSRNQAHSDVVHQRDSAGIRIIETPGAAARSPIGWTVGNVPQLQLGSPTDEGPELFQRIGGWSGGIAGLPDGRMVVVDGGSGQLRFFDSDGRFLNSAGGLGNGPGEFRSPRLIPYASSDSVLMFDGRHRRFTLFSSDGQAHRNFPVEGLPRQLLAGGPHGASDSGILMTSTLGVGPMNEGQKSEPMRVRWITLESKREEIVAEFQILTYFTNDLGVPYRLDVPFSVRPSAAVGPRGFFVSGGDAPEVREFDNSGRLIRIFRLNESSRPVTPEDLESAIDFLVTRFTVPPAQARRVFMQMDFPDRWPTFQSIRIDPLGWIWAELFRPTQKETSRWMVFDPDGVARGIVELPLELEVHDIGRDYVLGRWQDSLRVEYVRRYRLDRRR